MIYLYENHMGGCFITREELSPELLFCDQCGDSDWLITSMQTGGDLLDALAWMLDEGYAFDYIEEFVSQFELSVTLPDKLKYAGSEYMYIYKDDDDITAKCSLFEDMCYKWHPEYDTLEDAEYIDCDYCVKRFEQDIRELNPDIAAISNIEEWI